MHDQHLCAWYQRQVPRLTSVDQHHAERVVSENLHLSLSVHLHPHLHSHREPIAMGPKNYANSHHQLVSDCCGSRDLDAEFTRLARLALDNVPHFKHVKGIKQSGLQSSCLVQAPRYRLGLRAQLCLEHRLVNWRARLQELVPLVNQVGQIHAKQFSLVAHLSWL